MSTPRSSRLIRRSGALLLLLGLISTVLASPTADARPLRDARPVRAVDRVEELRLACSPDIVGDERGVVCRWSESTSEDLRGYQLYRITNGAARVLVATVAGGERLHAFDSDAAAGDRLIYGVVARNGSGRVIGRGGPVRLGIPG